MHTHTHHTPTPTPLALTVVGADNVTLPDVLEPLSG